jgi:hypothetical protein
MLSPVMASAKQKTGSMNWHDTHHEAKKSITIFSHIPAISHRSKEEKAWWLSSPAWTRSWITIVDPRWPYVNGEHMLGHGVAEVAGGPLVW